jgi:hypothetical protein
MRRLATDILFFTLALVGTACLRLQIELRFNQLELDYLSDALFPVLDVYTMLSALSYAIAFFLGGAITWIDLRRRPSAVWVAVAVGVFFIGVCAAVRLPEPLTSYAPATEFGIWVLYWANLWGPPSFAFVGAISMRGLYKLLAKNAG